MQYYITGRPLKSSACCILQASRAQNWFQFLENQFGSLWLNKSLIMSSPFLLTSHHPVLPSLTQPARPPLWSPHHLPGDKWRAWTTWETDEDGRWRQRCGHLVHLHRECVCSREECVCSRASRWPPAGFPTPNPPEKTNKQPRPVKTPHK